MTRNALFLMFIVCGLMTESSLAQSRLYKWTDEDGQVRYSDKVPPEVKKQTFQTLSPEGLIVETHEAPLSPEEKKARRQRALEEKIRAEERAKIAREKEFHDRVLLMTYNTEDEISVAKQERLSVIDSVINLLKKDIENERLKLQELQQQAKQRFTDNGREIPGGMAQKIDYSSDKIIRTQNQLSLKFDERQRVEQQYNIDLLRYRELVQQQKELGEQVNP